MIKTQIHSRRRKPTKSTLSASPGQSQGQGQVISHDSNSNQSDPEHFAPSVSGDDSTPTGNNNSTGVLDMSTAEVRLESHPIEIHDLSAEDDSLNANEVK